MADRQTGERTRVMIIEQDLGVGLKLADLLATHGYQPIFVRSVDAAIDELSAIHPQAIVVGLPSAESQSRMNADEVLLIIQTICPLAPVATVAGQIVEDLTQVVFRQGARRFVVKPVECSQVGQVILSELNAAAA
ncbi:MAG: hypothetical protein CAF41_006100 [Nitrospira sp. CG24A]|nr:MAG: hypothetical protein CAF41_006100 [Nitrospira sp. CG24A]